MQEVTLQALLEAGCHFGHKAERWHPKASQFIYTKKDGIHIIDLAKTKSGLEVAAEFVKSTLAQGGDVLFVGTKRQARGVLKEEATAVSAPYFSERWIGGFLTNWDQIRKNIDKIIRMDTDRASGAWKKFPKHEQSKMSRYLERIKIYYGGVLAIAQVPQAVFVVDVRKEIAAVREARRRGVPVIGIVDTNSDPTNIDYVIPANDDAVGSVTYIVHYIAEAYREGKELRAKQDAANAEKLEKERLAAEKKIKDSMAVMPEKGSEVKAFEVEKPKVSKEKKAKK
jgi:small subunit ribosomal protein S2